MESPYSTDFLLDASFDSTASRFNALKDNNFNTEFRLFESLKMSDEYDDAPLEADYSEREVLEEKDVDDGQFAPASPLQRDSRIATPTSPARTPSAEPPVSPVPTYERRVESPIEVVAPAPQIDEYKDKENDDYKAGRPKIGWAPVEEPRSPPQTENDSKAVVKEKSVKNLIARFNTGEAFQSNSSSSGDYKKDYGVAGGTGSVNKGIFQ